MPRADVLLNPISGSAAGARAVARFRAALERGGWEVRLRPTERAGHAPELARRAADEGADAVVAAGGDGTLNEVATGLLAAGKGAPPLAILARGTSNLVARDLGVPLDAGGAAATLLAGHVRAIDVVSVRPEPAPGAALSDRGGAGPAGGVPERLMFACAGVGWDAHVVRELAARRRGHITVRTWLGPIRAALREYTFPVFRVVPEGGAPVEAVLAMFLNCRPYARWFVPAPGARPDDGILHAAIVRPEGRGRFGRIAWRAWRGTLAADPAATVVAARSFRVEADGAVPCQIDGDVGGAAPLTLTVLPRALRVLAPAAPAGG